MIQGRVCRTDKGSCIIPRVYKTTGIRERMQGLLGRTPLQENEALLLKPCSSVHSFGMRYTIDLVYLNRRWEIIKTVKAFKPWHISFCLKAHIVIEMIAGSLERLQLINGMQLVWQDE